MPRKPYLKKRADIPRLPEIQDPEWDNIIRDLMFRGYTKLGLAHLCEIARETVQNILEGNTEPRWYAGQKLLQLHNEVKKRNITSERKQSGED